MSSRIPPNNLESEQALLGSILLRPISIHDVADLVNSDDFYAEKHRIIYDAMKELYDRREPIDILTVSSRLREKKQLDLVGGTTYINHIASNVPASTNVEHYASIVASKAARRRLIEAGTYVADLGYQEDQHIDAVLDEAEQKIFRATQSTTSNSFVTIKDVIPDVWETFETLQNSDQEMRGVPTGFKGIDAKLSGLQKSDFVILAARPSTGKTSLALDIARKSAVHHQQKVGFFSLEMSAQQLTDRLVSAESGVPLWKIRTGRSVTEQDMDHMREAMARISDSAIYIDDQAGNSINKMRAAARRLKSRHGLDLIIIDYLQLMTTARHYDSVVHQVSDISRSLKGLARELDVPVLSLSQLSRAVEARGGKPRLSDLRDSGAIEQDADVVMFLHREKKEDGGGRENQTEVLIEKHRNGPTGVVNLYFDAEKTSFTDVEVNEYETFGIE